MFLPVLILFLAQTSTGTVEGLVARDGTSEPVAGASVNLSGIGPVATDDSGRFRFVNVPEGSYRVSATRAGYMPGSFGEHGPNGPGMIFTIAAGQEIKDIVIHLTPKGSISGRVLTPDGNPARNAAVQLMRYMYVDGRRMLTISQLVRTNDAGDYRFADIQPDQYVVSVFPGGTSYLPVYFPGTLDPDTTSPIDLLPGIEHGGADLTIVERDALRISGQVLDAVTGLAPQSVFAIMSPRERRTLIAGISVPRKISIAPDGKFLIGDVAPGFYDLLLTVGDGSERRVARVAIQASRDVEDLRLVLRPVFDLNGHVSIEGLPGSETDLQTVKVELVHEPYITQVNPRAAEVHPDGSFVLTGVMPGDYRVRVTAKLESYVMFARFRGADILNSVVHIDDSSGNDLEIRLKPNISALDATVYDDKNAPLEGVRVVLVPDYPNRQRLDVYETGITDRSGHLHLKDLEPGNYKAFAWEYLEAGRWQDADFIQRYEDLGTPVHIAESATGSITLRVIKVRR
jgi:hypothetical protein